MALTAKQVHDLNNAMEANRRANVGSMLSGLDDNMAGVIQQIIDMSIVRGSYIATADDVTAGGAEIATGLAQISGFIVQIFRAGVIVTEDSAIGVDEGDLLVADGAVTYDITADDVINYIVW